MTDKELFQSLPEDYALIVEEHVRWGDMDAFAHMNNTVFFQLFESARMAYFENIGFIEYMEAHKVGPILAHTDCHFRRPLSYPNKLLVATRVETIQNDRFVMQYAIFNDSSVPELAACGSGLIVCYDYEKQQKSALPEQLLMRINTLESKRIRRQ